MSLGLLKFPIPGFLLCRFHYPPMGQKQVSHGHTWPQMVTGLPLAMLCLQNWFIDINLCIMALLSNLAFCHTWLHINQHCPMAPQNLQNWNHKIWNIFLRFVGFDLVVKKNTKPMITIHNSTKTMPEDIHVNADLTFCIHFLIWHQWPYIGHKALFIWPY